MSECIHFEPYLYSEAGVRAAAEAYGELVDVAIEVTGTAIVATLSGEVDQELCDHFANHALYETVAQARRAVAGGRPA